MSTIKELTAAHHKVSVKKFDLIDIQSICV